jgi:uncharacterized protein
MELTPDKGDGLHIRAYHNGQIETDKQTYSTSIIITPETVKLWRPKQVDELNEEDLLQLIAFNPRIVLIGTGAALKFPPPSLFRLFIEKHIGYEIMNTAAACRTYNVLMTENRLVVAGLLLDNR